MLLEALVHDKIRYLDILMYECPVLSEFLKSRGCVPSLETFVWGSKMMLPPPFAFLQANPQITTLAIPSPISSTTLSEQLLPLLSKSFFNLTSLFLVWQSLSIPESDLEMISRIVTLKHIHLSAGDQHSGSHDWMINHKSLQRNICRLPLIQHLVFSRDGYDNEFSSKGTKGFGRYYYRGTIFGVGDEEDEEWDRGHRQRMLDEAANYVSVMPRLKLLCFGQIEMAVTTKDPENVRTVYVVEPGLRVWDESDSRRMFSGPKSWDYA